MDTAERSLFYVLRSCGSRTIYRVSDYSKTTGWFLSKPIAREQWRGPKLPLAAESLTVRSDDVFAVKIIGGDLDVVLVPGRVRCLVREPLAMAREGER